MRNRIASYLLVAFTAITSSLSADASELSKTLIRYQQSFTSEGVRYTMYWTGFHVDKMMIDDIYIVPKAIVNDRDQVVMNNNESTEVTINGEKWWSVPTECPMLVGIRYHHIETGNNAFVGAIVQNNFRNASMRLVDFSKYGRWEIRLPDDIAELLLDLAEGKTKYHVEDRGSIERMFQGKFMEKTNSTQLLPLKIYYYE